MKTEINAAIKLLAKKIDNAVKSDDALRYTQAALNLAHLSTQMQATPNPAPEVTDDMVSRFLAWRLPEDFAPDCGISFKRESDYAHPEHGRTQFKPTGTNLLHAGQVRAMLEHILQAEPA